MTKIPPILLIVGKEEKPNPEMLQHITSRPVHYLPLTSAADCLKAVIEKKAGVIVVDEDLPDLPGLTLVTLLKKMRPELEIIFTTSCHEPQKEKDARLAGILYYAVKPVNWALLGQVIDRALTKQQEKLLLTNP